MTKDFKTIKEEILALSGDSKWNFIKTKASASEFIQFWKSIKLGSELDVFSLESSEITIDQVIVWLRSNYAEDELPIYTQDLLKLQITQQEELSNICRLIFFRQYNKESKQSV